MVDFQKLQNSYRTMRPVVVDVVLVVVEVGIVIFLYAAVAEKEIFRQSPVVKR